MYTLMLFLAFGGGIACESCSSRVVHAVIRKMASARKARTARLAIATALLLMIVGTSGCAVSKGKGGICYSLGPGQICVDLSLEGETKHVVLPEEVVRSAPTIKSPSALSKLGQVLIAPFRK